MLMDTNGHTILSEDYVSFEVAKLLKEKGFIERSAASYDSKGQLKEGYAYWNKTPIWYAAPTHQMAMKWLREVHKLTFIISPQWAEGYMRNPCRWYWEIRGLEDINIDVYNNPLCNTYEQAVEAALKHCLENLI